MAAFPPARLTEQMSEASHDVSKLPASMISCGVAVSAAALSLVCFKAPEGILLRLHGNTPVVVYYGTLIAAVILGLVEASFGYWLVPRDHGDWRTVVGRAMLGVSIFALVVVAALGGSAFLK